MLPIHNKIICVNSDTERGERGEREREGEGERERAVSAQRPSHYTTLGRGYKLHTIPPQGILGSIC